MSKLRKWMSQRLLFQDPGRNIDSIEASVEAIRVQASNAHAGVGNVTLWSGVLLLKQSIEY